MREIIAIDSGPCVALFNKDDAFHEAALGFIKRCTGLLVSNLPVVTEVTYLLDFSVDAQVDFLRWVASGAVALLTPEQTDFGRVADLMRKYADLPMDFGDGLLVALCERYEIRNIASIDQDFSIYRFKGRSKFVNRFWE